METIEEFIPYEEAFALQQLGFNEKSFYIFDNQRENIMLPIYGLFDIEEPERFIKAPLYQQAFKWLRKHYKLSCHADISYVNHLGESYYYQIINFADVIDKSTTIRNNGFKSIEEAELACLQKAIELLTMIKSKVIKDPDFSLLTAEWLETTFENLSEDIMNGETIENVVINPETNSRVLITFDVDCGRRGLFRGHSIMIHKDGKIRVDLDETPIEGCGIEEELKTELTLLLF